MAHVSASYVLTGAATDTTHPRVHARKHTAVLKDLARIAEKSLGRTARDITDYGRMQCLARTPSELRKRIRIGVAAALAAGWKVAWVVNTLDHRISTHANGGFRSILMLFLSPDGIVIETQWQLIEIQAIKVCYDARAFRTACPPPTHQ